MLWSHRAVLQQAEHRTKLGTALPSGSPAFGKALQAPETGRQHGTSLDGHRDKDELYGTCRSTAASQLALGSAIKEVLLDSLRGLCIIYIFIQIFPGEERQSC